MAEPAIEATYERAGLAYHQCSLSFDDGFAAGDRVLRGVALMFYKPDRGVWKAGKDSLCLRLVCNFSPQQYGSGFECSGSVQCLASVSAIPNT